MRIKGSKHRDEPVGIKNCDQKGSGRTTLGDIKELKHDCLYEKMASKNLGAKM